MTIRRRLARSNLVMILIPVAIAAVLLLLGGGLALCFSSGCGCPGWAVVRGPA